MAEDQLLIYIVIIYKYLIHKEGHPDSNNLQDKYDQPLTTFLVPYTQVNHKKTMQIH